MSTVGNILKSEREKKLLSIENISEELKVSKSIILELEDDNISKDYNLVYYIGHLRSYCNYLNLDPKIIIDKFKIQISYTVNEEIKEIPKPNFQNNKFKYIRLFSPTLIIIIFSSFYLLFIKETNNSLEFALIPDLPESYIPVIEKTNLVDVEKKSEFSPNLSKNIENFSYSSAVASNTPNESDVDNTVTLKILNSTWLQLRDESNNIIISQLMNKGEEYTYKLNDNYNVTSGNAGNIMVIINGEVRGKVGDYGDVIDSIIIDSNFNN